MKNLQTILKKINKFTGAVGNDLHVIKVLDKNKLVATDGFRMIVVEFDNRIFDCDAFVKYKDGIIRSCSFNDYPNVEYVLNSYENYDKKQVYFSSDYDIDYIITAIIRNLNDKYTINIQYIKDCFTLYKDGTIKVEIIESSMPVVKIKYYNRKLAVNVACYVATKEVR